jgi:quinol monooxygenase YgiN
MSIFLSKAPPTMPTGLDLSHYAKVAGYIDAPGDKRECAIMVDTRVSCISATARSTVILKLSQLAKSVEKDAQGVYTWMAFSSLDSDTALRIFARFESREAMEVYQRRKDVADFWAESKDDVGTRECQRYAPNGKGWLHR